ncbi:MAG: amidase [Acidimicrobiales bacterium]|nr:amidase [Acidimicrobiales bacterium]
MSIADAYDSNDGVGLAQLVASGQLKPSELLDEAIARSDVRNAEFNAIVDRFDDKARAQIDAGRGSRGPLWGVPFVLKDLYADYEGTRLTNGSRSWADHVSTGTSYAVDRFLDAGLITFARTNSPEFGLSTTTENVLHGPARNPWNTNHTTGGSSGGSGAAVAAGIVPIAHATDGGGSIRIPASCNGLVGLKPTRARTPSGPPVGEGWAGMSIGHVVCHTVRDSAAVLDATHGVAPGGPYAAPEPSGRFTDAVGREPGPLRIGWTTVGRPDVTVDAEVAAGVAATAAALEGLGHDVFEQSLASVDWSAFGHAFGIITSTGVGADIAARAAATGVEPSTDILEPMSLLQTERSAAITGIEYLQAVQTIHRLGRDNAALWESFDVLVCPTLPNPPAELGTLTGPLETVAEWGPRLIDSTAFTGLFNATGQPAISLPLAMSDSGLPIGIQLVGRFGDEETLLTVAAQLEQAMPWADRRA